MAEVVSNLLKAGLSPETVEEIEKRLQELKERRLREAESMELGKKIAFIVDEYGTCDFHGCTCWFDTMINGKKARLLANCVHGQAVFIEGRTVYNEVNHKPELFVPGTWVTAVLNLYEAAKLRRAKRELEAKIRALEEEAERWGVRLEDLICPSCDDAPF